jgi:hypothetical protein
VPTVHREAGFVFYFYAEEGTEARHALRIAEQQQTKLREAWNEFFCARKLERVLKFVSGVAALVTSAVSP